MEMLKERIKQTQDLQQKIQQRRKEVQAQVAQAQQSAQANRTSNQSQQRWDSIGTAASSYSRGSSSGDPLEKQFQRWEAEEELEQMKRNMGK
jgi:hypothetical protein